MSREILFRGKREDNGEWIYGYYCNCVKAVGMETIPSIQQTDDNSLYFREINPETVGQFTGLTDKNGTKIFEGDIVKFKDYDKLPFVGEVKYIKEVAGFVVYVVCKNVYSSTILWAFVDINLEQTEVIGNIHDNPELLQENK